MSAGSESENEGAAPTVGHENIVFLDQPLDENLRCPICLEVSEEATTACSAGHTFCGSCLQRMSARGDEKCPTCRAVRINLPNRPVRDMVDALSVRCNEGEGEGEESARKRSRTEAGGSERESGNSGSSRCVWEGTLGQWKDRHTKVCPFRKIECPIGCAMTMRRMDVERHKEVCPDRPMECKYCKEMIPNGNRKLRSHMKHSCPKIPVKCEYCNEEMTREELGTARTTYPPQEIFPSIGNSGSSSQYTGHYAICPKMILHCEFARRGCNAKFAREDAAAHHAEKAQYHAALLDQTLERLQEWDCVQMIWFIRQERVAGNGYMAIESSTSANPSPYELFLKLYLRGPNDAIKFTVCSKSISYNPFVSLVRLKYAEVKVTGPGNSTVYAKMTYPGEHTVDPEQDNPGVFESLSYSPRKFDGTGFTRSDLMNTLSLDENDGLCAIRVTVHIHKVNRVVVH